MYWADLGTAFDWAGNRSEALRAFERSQGLFPASPDVNWKLANFYIRSGKTLEGLRTLRKVLLGGGVPQQDVFALAERATEDRKTILEEMVPKETATLIAYLNYQAGKGDALAAEQAWSKLLALRLPFELSEAFVYLDALIQKRQTEQLAEAWSALADRFPQKVGSLRVTPSLVTNGSFESDILNGAPALARASIGSRRPYASNLMARETLTTAICFSTCWFARTHDIGSPATFEPMRSPRIVARVFRFLMPTTQEKCSRRQRML